MFHKRPVLVRNLVARTKLFNQDTNSARAAAVVHPVKDSSRSEFMWNSFWNISEHGAPFPEARSHQGCAFTASTDRSTGELRVASLRIDETVPAPAKRSARAAAPTRAELLEAVARALSPGWRH
jgi:hypothetical protein